MLTVFNISQDKDICYKTLCGFLFLNTLCSSAVWDDSDSYTRKFK